MKNVVQVQVFLADIKDFAAMNEIYTKYFTQPYPARAAIQAAAYNTLNGYVARWTGVTAADGSFTVISQNIGAGGPGESIKSYGMEGFMLAQVPEPATMALLGLVMLQMKMDKSFKTVNLLWILLKGICCGEGTETV